MDRRSKLHNFLIKTGYEEEEAKKKPEPIPEPEPKEETPSFYIKCKRSTKMMYEVLPWARQEKYLELAGVQ